MKILQVLPSLAAGGAEGFITNLSVSLHRLGCDVCLYTLGGVRGERGEVLRSRLEEAGVDVQGVTERYPGSPRNLVDLARLVRSWQPDIVQANLYPAEVACSGARLLAVGSKARYFRRLANTDFVGYRSPGIVRAMDRFFPHVVACSEAVADAYREFMGANQRARLIAIPNGGLLLESVPSADDKRLARAGLDVPADAFVVVHIGRMTGCGGAKMGGLETGQKAHDVLLRSFARLLASESDAVLLLAGDGPLRPEVETLADELGIHGNVRFLGQIPEPWPVLKAADVFCFPSRYEGLPNVLPEAASAGLPVVASDIPEIASLSPGDAWQLKPVDDVDAFAEALRQVRDGLPVYTKQAADVAEHFRQRFSMDNCARKYLAAYREAAGAHGDTTQQES